MYSYCPTRWPVAQSCACYLCTATPLQASRTELSRPSPLNVQAAEVEDYLKQMSGQAIEKP
eukprot:2685069-Prymnesium_polylepis.2